MNNSNAKKDEGPKRSKLFVLYGSVLTTSPLPKLRQMPLFFDNCIPTAIIRFGDSSENEIPFTCHLDSCAAMNTANLLLYQWIITTYPSIVLSYEQFDDISAFCPLGLDCAVTSADANKVENKLTAVVTYKTRCTDNYGKHITLSFGLGKAIKVNAIIGLPISKHSKIILDLDTNRVTSKHLGVYFDLCFQNAAQGLPPNVKTNDTNFIRPARQSHTELVLMTKYTESLTIPLPPKVIDENSVTINIPNDDSSS